MSDQKTPFTRIEGILTFVGNACMLIACLALVVLVSTFGWLVFGRYVLNETPTWVEQLALLLICYIVFLGAVSGMRDETHLGVSLFRDLLPNALQKIIMIVIDAALAAFGVIMFLAGTTLVQFGWDSLLPMLDIPESFRTLAITICGALTFGICATRAVLRILAFSRWEPMPDTPDTPVTSET